MNNSEVRLLYSAPDIEVPGAHGGSAHVGEAVHSLGKFSQRIYLVCSWRPGQRFYEKTKNLIIFRIPVPPVSYVRVAVFFIVAFFISFVLCLFNKVNLVYERGRIFGGGAICGAALVRTKSVYEMIEPFTEVPVILGVLKNSSWKHRAITRWHTMTANRATIVTITHPCFLKGITTKHILVDAGVDPQKFNPNISSRDIRKSYRLTRGKTLFYAGSFNEWHSCENIIKAAQKVITKDQRVKFLLAGAGKRYARCAELVRQYKLEKNVLLIGEIPFKEMPNYVAASDVCFALFDRNYPPFKSLDYFYSPIKVHEYKSCGKAVIASDMGNLRKYVVNGKNGYLVNEQDVESIVGAIQKLIAHPVRARCMGKANRKDVLENYTWDFINKKILSAAGISFEMN